MLHKIKTHNLTAKKKKKFTHHCRKEEPSTLGDSLSVAVLSQRKEIKNIKIKLYIRECTLEKNIASKHLMQRMISVSKMEIKSILKVKNEKILNTLQR